MFSLDTGRLHPETYQFLEKVRDHYGIPIDAYFPQPDAVQKLVREKGLFSFYKDGHKECCGIRKVEPLIARAEAAAAPGSPASARTRARARAPTCPVVQLDRTFGIARAPAGQVQSARATGPRSRCGPTSASTTCRTTRCTIAASSRSAASPARAPTNPGQHEREGRWWWEEETKKECGLHVGNVE